jgi:polyhydroxybutyrate depolymerase
MRQVLLALSLCCACTPNSTLSQPHTESNGTGGASETKEWPPPDTIGTDRPAVVSVPSSYDAKQPLPAVFLLAGYDHASTDLDDWIGVSDKLDALDFVLVQADGLRDSDGAHFWNATDGCCDYDETGVDDVGYLTDLISELIERFAVDQRHIIIVGHSNGGFMGYRMACEPNSPISALVSIAGATWLNAADCQATRPVSVLQIHGDSDENMPFEGDESAPGALEALTRWGARADCDLSSWNEEPEKLELADDTLNEETTVSRYTSGCKTGTDIALWFLEATDHYPPLRASATSRALSWAVAQENYDLE